MVSLLNPYAKSFEPKVPSLQERAEFLAASNLNPNAKEFTPSLNPLAKEFTMKVPDHMEAMSSKNLQKEQARRLYMQYFAEDDEYFGACV